MDALYIKVTKQLRPWSGTSRCISQTQLHSATVPIDAAATEKTLALIATPKVVFVPRTVVLPVALVATNAVVALWAGIIPAYFARLVMLGTTGTASRHFILRITTCAVSNIERARYTLHRLHF